MGWGSPLLGLQRWAGLRVHGRLLRWSGCRGSRSDPFSLVLVPRAGRGQWSRGQDPWTEG